MCALFWDGRSAGTISFETFSETVFQLHVTPKLIAEGLVFAVVVGIIGSLLPALRAARLPVISALKSGHLSGAGLDVFQQEPLPPTSPLLQLDNVVLCPHLGGTDTRSSEDMGIECAHNIVKLSRNEWPEGAVVNADLRATWKW